MKERIDRFEELIAWQKARVLTFEIYKISAEIAIRGRFVDLACFNIRDLQSDHEWRFRQRFWLEESDTACGSINNVKPRGRVRTRTSCRIPSVSIGDQGFMRGTEITTLRRFRRGLSGQESIRQPHGSCPGSRKDNRGVACRS